MVRSALSRFCSSRSWRRLLPLTSCITTAWRPPSSIASYTATMFGWLSCATAIASRRNRSATTGSVASVGLRTLIATLRVPALQPVAGGENGRRERRRTCRSGHALRTGTLLARSSPSPAIAARGLLHVGGEADCALARVAADDRPDLTDDDLTVVVRT